MTTAAFIIIGILIGSAISDLAFDWRIYRLFPNQKRLWWPGAGYWMAWKTILIARNARNRIGNLHALASSFPASTAHRDETRAFVSMVAKMTDIGLRGPNVKVEHKQAEEVKP